MKEQVNHPDHYRGESGKECIDYMIERWGYMCTAAFCVLNAFKYRFRKGRKDDNPEEQDKKKARWYENYAYYSILPKVHGINRIIIKRMLSKL